MNTLLQILIATIAVSLISFAGVLFISKKMKLSKGILELMVSFAAGAILAAVFFDLLPEAFEEIHTLLYVLVGIVVFFIIEAFIHWHHHDDECAHHKHKKPVVALNLIGDGLHNFLDGILIAASFLVSPVTGIATAFAIALHEIPQEIGDFAILVKGGLTKKKALIFNFLSGITAILGGLIAYFALSSIEGLIPYIISLAAGGLLYIATTDVLPELHKERKTSRIILQIIAFIIGVVIIGLILGTGHGH